MLTRTTLLQKQFLTLCLMGVMTFLFSGFSTSAYAADVTYTDPCADQQQAINKEFQNAFGQTAMMKSAAATQMLGMYGAIDISTQYCWSKISAAFDAIQHLGTMSPNPFTFIIGVIISEIAHVIVSIIGQVCSAIVQDINGFKQGILSALSRFCIPIPNLQLSLGSISTGSFSNAGPCTGGNGIPLFTFGYALPPPPMSPPGSNGNIRSW